jgi:hypothetical protein
VAAKLREQAELVSQQNIKESDEYRAFSKSVML